MKGSTFLSLVGVGVIMLLIGIAIGSSSPPTTETTTQIQTITVTSPTNSNYTTQTIDCSGAPVCGLSSVSTYADSTTTVIIFEYPSSNTTSYYTLTLTHQNSTT